mmetsp:Transcript_28629/g.56076  ORF Transcript_28629/g.56076 Transcript_28629/m.56076 type:complete len:133 (-) Transcript_28629:3-401(-)
MEGGFELAAAAAAAAGAEEEETLSAGRSLLVGFEDEEGGGALGFPSCSSCSSLTGRGALEFRTSSGGVSSSIEMTSAGISFSDVEGEAEGEGEFEETANGGLEEWVEPRGGSCTRAPAGFGCALLFWFVWPF